MPGVAEQEAPRTEYLPTMQMSIVKASFDKSSQEMRWRSVNSDTEEDLYNERMTPELFADFCRRIDDGLPVPEPFNKVMSEDGWDGINPYLSISHYKSAGGKNVPGEVHAVYVDGDKLKSHGIMYDNELGRAAFKSLLNDLYGKSDYENKVRISIGFLDLQHSHGDYVFTRSKLSDRCPLCAEGVGNKAYLKGQLVHLALTRVPVNPRTDIGVEKMNEPIVTKRKDAESIVGEAANLIVERAGTELPADGLVVKATDPEPSSTPVIDPAPAPVETPAVIATPDPSVALASPVVEDSAVEKALTILKNKVIAVKQAGAVGDNALQAVQAEFDQVAEALKSEFAVPAKPVDMNDIASVIRATMLEVVPGMIEASVGPIRTQIGTILAGNAQVQTRSQNVPNPRAIKLQTKSLTGTPPSGTVTAAIEQKSKGGARKIKDLARESTVGTLPQY